MNQSTNKSETITKIAQALGEFQSKCPILNKGTQGYGYKYADLPSIVQTITPILRECGLCFTQLAGNNEDYISVTTILIHTESGEYFETKISSSIKYNKGNISQIQVVGAIITYLRRYSLSAILGIVTDEDVDGHIPKFSINEIIEQAKLCTTVEQLKDFWDENEDFHKDKTFLSFIKGRREKLEKNKEGTSQIA